MSKKDIKAIIKDLKKNELTELISVAQEVLSTLFNSSEIRENVKESRFSKGYECPKCQCKDVNKNGKSNGRRIFSNFVFFIFFCDNIDCHFLSFIFHYLIYQNSNLKSRNIS